MQHFDRSSPASIAPLDGVGWLAEQSEELKEWFVSKGNWRRLPEGQALYLTDDETDGIYGLGMGMLDVEYAPDELESFVLIRIEPGAWIGQEAIMPGQRRPFSLIAATDCEVFFVSRYALRKLLEQRPHLWPAFYSLAIIQALKLMEFLCEALTLTPEMRLARLLLRLSATTPDVAASQRELGALLGMPRSSLRRSLAVLSDAGAIRTGYGKVSVIDKAALEKITALI